ncbi:MAG: hypothetical protein ACLR53_01060 [Evtepia gabavorous]
MLFVKNRAQLFYCQRGKAVTPDTVLCKKKGVILAGACSAFRYDPLKRVPPRPVTPDFCHLDGKDFTL